MTHMATESMLLATELKTLYLVAGDESIITFQKKGRDGASLAWNCQIVDANGDQLLKVRGPSLRRVAREAYLTMLNKLRQDVIRLEEVVHFMKEENSD